MASNAFSLARAGSSSTLARVAQVLDTFAARDRDGEILTAVRHYPAREAQWAEFPEWVHAELRTAYNAKGIRQLYTHQAAAAETVHTGKSVVIVTPTASGKTLCYNLLRAGCDSCRNDDTRALYLFPDQSAGTGPVVAELHDLNGRLQNSRQRVHALNGDTPNRRQRKAIREKDHVVLDKIRTCCTPESWAKAPHALDAAVPKICATSWWTSCTPTGACLGSHLMQRAAAAATDCAVLWQQAAIYLLFGDDCKSRRTCFAAHRSRSGSAGGERRSRGGEDVCLLQPAGSQSRAGHPAKLHQ